MKKISLELIARFLTLLMPISLLVGKFIGEVCLGLTVVLFFIHVFKNKDFIWAGALWVKVALVTWLYVIVSSFFAVANIEDAFSRSIPFGRFIFYAISLQFWILKDHKFRKKLLCVMALCLAFVIVDGTVQYITGVSLTGHEKPSPTRLNGPFSKWVVGKYVSIFSLPIIGFLISSRLYAETVLKKYGPLFVGVASSLLFVLISGERMAFVLLAFCLGLFFLFAKGYRKPLFVAGISSIAVIIALVISVPQLRYRMIDYTQNQVESFQNSPYVTAFKRGVQVWQSQPIIGVGLRNYRSTCVLKDFGSLFSDRKDCGTHPHNMYIEWLSEAGLIGISLFLTLLFLWGRHIVVGLKTIDLENYYIALGAGLSLVSMLWPVASSQSFFSNWTGLQLWYILGFALSFHVHTYEKAQEQKS